MPNVDPQMAEILRLIAEQDLPAYESMSAADALAASEQRNAFWNEGNPDVRNVRDTEIPGAERTDAVAALRARWGRAAVAGRALHPRRRLGDLLARHA